jgi:diadenylate cyclase
VIEGLLHLFSARPWMQVLIDIIDLVLVTYVIYRALLVLRGTRAMQMGIGLGVILIVDVIARYAGLATLNNMLSSLLPSSSIILIVVVVFQNDIRRGLMRVGARAFLGGISREQESRVIDEVVAAATELARHRMGALICFEQDANLDEFVVGQGTIIDAAVQRELLVGLFVPESVNKLHDGAVVIRNLRIVKAGVFFPMPDIKSLDKSLGSRHRAALGITEETDAVVVVVSEERGTISFCFNGNIVSNLDGASLRQALLGLFGQRTQKKKKPAPGKRSNQHTGSHRISVIPQASTGASSGAATGNTGSVMLSPPQSTASPPSGMSTPGGMTPPSGLPTLSGLAPPSAREGVSPSSPPNPPRGRPLAPAKVDTPKPMSAVEPPESTSESTREPPENR